VMKESMPIPAEIRHHGRKVQVRKDPGAAFRVRFEDGFRQNRQPE